MKQENLLQLSAYLADVGDYVSGEELAARFHMTTRTIRNYVAEINASAENMPFILTSRRGYRWNIPADSPLVSRVPIKPDPQTPAERSGYILRQLLYRYNVQFDHLMERLAISDRTLEADLIGIKAVLRPYQIELHRRGELLYLRGPISQRRLLIYRLILQTARVDLLTLAFLESVFPEYSASAICRKADEILCKHGLAIYGDAIYELVLRMMIQLEQIHSNNIREAEEFVFLDWETYPDYLAAVELVQELEVMTGTIYPHSEIEYLTLLLIAKTMVVSPDPGRQPSAVRALRPMADSLLNWASHYMGASLIKNLPPLWFAVYLHRLLIRQQMKLASLVSFGDKLQIAYPSLYKIAADFLFQLSLQTGTTIAREEISSLGIILGSHICDAKVYEGITPCALVCPANPALATEIQIALQTHIGSCLDCRQILLTPDIDQLSDEIELVLSLVPLRYLPHCVQISPFPKSTDFMQIYREIQRIKTDAYIQKLLVFFSQYLDEAHFYPRVSIRGWRDLIHRVCSALVQEGSIDAEYEKHLLSCEAFDSSVRAGVMALPYAPHSSVLRDQLVLVTARDGIRWSGEKVDLVVFLLCHEMDQMDFRIIYDLLVKVFSQPRHVQEIRTATRLSEVIEVLRKL